MRLNKFEMIVPKYFKIIVQVTKYLILFRRVYIKIEDIY